MSKERKIRRAQHNHRTQADISRRRFLIGAGVALVAGGGIAYEVLRRQNPEPAGPDEDMKILQQEIARSGAIPDATEQQMWQRSYQRAKQAVPVTEETLPRVGTYLEQTIGNMASSKNKYFRHAADVIKEQNRIQLLRVSVEGFLQIGGHETFAAVSGVAEENRFRYVLYIDGGQVLNNSNSLLLAIALAHEAEHLEDGYKFQNSLPRNLTFQERVDREKQRRKSDPVLRETGAYAIQSEAFIEAFRLGVGSDAPDDMIHIAAEYIRAGKNKDSQAWKDFIARHIAQK